MKNDNSLHRPCLFNCSDPRSAERLAGIALRGHYDRQRGIRRKTRWVFLQSSAGTGNKKRQKVIFKAR